MSPLRRVQNSALNPEHQPVQYSTVIPPPRREYMSFIIIIEWDTKIEGNIYFGAGGARLAPAPDDCPSKNLKHPRAPLSLSLHMPPNTQWFMFDIDVDLEQIAARNNMEVYKDKCLKGSLRVARPGELARKIVDIVSDDQDAEPEAVVHTHLCILLAEGDDLELKRPRMFPSTPRAILSSSQHGSSGDRVIKHSKSLGNLSSGAGNPVDLSQVTLDDNGVPKLLHNSSGEVGDDSPGQEGVGSGGGKAQTFAELQVCPWFSCIELSS